MSWDIFLTRQPSSVSPLEPCEDPADLFDLASAEDAIRALCPQAVKYGPLRLSCEAPCFAVEFELAEDAILLRVHIFAPQGERDFIKLLGELCARLHCRAFDAAAGDLPGPADNAPDRPAHS